MAIAKPLPELEVWLDTHANHWRILFNREYGQLIRDWSEAFLHRIEQRERHLSGRRALDAFALRLPANVFFFSGVEIPAVANTGGRCASGYQVEGLETLDRDMVSSFELVVVDLDFSWCLLLSHEHGNEEFWEREVD